VRCALLLVIASATIAAEPGPWRTLLAKDSFAGWRSPSGETDLEGAWTIHGGVLTVKPYVHRRTDLWSVDDYENFELEWEWKAAKAANSGVKYWVRSATTLVIVEENEKFRPIAGPRAAQPNEVTLEYSTGLEYQMADDAHEPTSLIRRDSRAGGLYSVFPPEPEAVKPHGQWNRSRILVRDGRFEHWLNGQRVLAYDLAKLEAQTKGRPSFFKRGGPIALQYHQTVVSFRRMRVRRW
jgi:hypothetical protein